MLFWTWLLASCSPTQPPMGGWVAGCSPFPNCVSTAVSPDDMRHRAEPFAFDGDVPAAKARMKAIVAAMPRTALVEESEDALRFTFTSERLRFVDDLEFVFVAETGWVEYRSASRLGYGDMGANRERVRAIAEAWTPR